MNKGELIKEVAEQTGVSKDKVRCITTHLMRLIYKHTQNDLKISLRGFGTFRMTSIKSKRSYNISTHSIEDLPATRKLKFTPSQNFKKSVKQQEKRLKTTDTKIANQVDFILSTRPKYIRVTLNDSRQVILNGDSFETQITNNLEKQLTGRLSYLSWEKVQYKYSDLKEIEPLSTLFSDIYWQRNTPLGVFDKSCIPILINAAFTGSPIWIKYKHYSYTKGFDEEYEDYVRYLYLSNDHPFTKPNSWAQTLFTEILAWEDDTFYIQGYRLRYNHFIEPFQILEIKVVNCVKDFETIKVYENSLRKLVLYPYGYGMKARYIERIEALILRKEAFSISDLLFKQLLAHYETIKGNVEYALSIYLSIDYDTKIDSSTWGKSCLSDINA